MGKMKAFLHRPPHLQICYMREDGQWFRYRTSVELLKAGLFVGDLITSDADYQSLVTGKHLDVIKKIKFEYDYKYFKESGMMDAYRVNCVQDTIGNIK
jgi:hypothetical protein